MRPTFYGGAGEVGGNKILVEDRDSRILLDFGMSLGYQGRFFSEPFLSPRDERGMIDLESFRMWRGFTGGRRSLRRMLLC